MEHEVGSAEIVTMYMKRIRKERGKIIITIIKYLLLKIVIIKYLNYL